MREKSIVEWKMRMARSICLIDGYSDAAVIFVVKEAGLTTGHELVMRMWSSSNTK